MNRSLSSVSGAVLHHVREQGAMECGDMSPLFLRATEYLLVYPS